MSLRTRPLLLAICLAFFSTSCTDDDSNGSNTGSGLTGEAFTPADGDKDVFINRKVTASFSEPVVAGSVTGTTFTLQAGPTFVVGTTSTLGKVATFKPAANLSTGTVYTATITTGIKGVSGTGLAAAKSWSFTTGATADSEAPFVSSTEPTDGDTGVVLNGNVTVSFSEALDAATVGATTITLMQGTTPLPGTVSAVGSVVTLNPDADLTADTEYTVTLTSGLMDLAGNAVAVATSFRFTTGATADAAAPEVIATNPVDGGTDVSVNRSVVATFSEALDAVTITDASFTLMRGTTSIAGAVTSVGSVMTFNPTSDLAASTVYTATIAAGAKDVVGNGLAASKSWSFTTGATSDTTVPAVVATEPEDGDTDVVLNRDVVATFSETLDPTTITGTTFTLKNGTTSVSGVTSSVGSIATFHPTSNLTVDTEYTATVTTQVLDVAGNALAVEKTWTFTTGSVSAAGPMPVALGTAREFVILSKAGITNVANSSITGDIGTSPITGASVVGLDCVQVVGRILTVDPTGPACRTTDSVYLTTAVSDMEIAYTDAAGRVSPDETELGAGEIGGLTIAPGLYKWGTDVMITTDVKISGGANDVWIFQVSGDLIQANGIRVTLEGQAQAKNVFWQVAGQVSVGTTAHMEGTVLSQTLIALKTGATMNGRALAQTSVTLESNTVVLP